MNERALKQALDSATRCLQRNDWGTAFDRVQDALALLEPKPTHIHHKSGGKYREVARGFLQTAQPLTDLCELVSYVGEDGRTWFRPPSEFDDDERFGLLPAGVMASDGSQR